jgi:ABC-2 type transport system ATP-binding protein
MIEVHHLVKDYGTVVAVNDVSFQVGRGEVVGFLGPNGAGKSTTLRIIAGFLGPTSGRVRIDGHDVIDDAIGARRAIGYMPEATPLYPEMRVSEYLRFRAELKGVGRKDRKSWVGRAMEMAGVSEMSETLIGHLSKGYRQRVGLADALVAKPPMLILDEPTAGLDPNQIREVRALVRELGKDHTIFLSTHILPEVEATCARAIVIDRGKLVAEGTIDELRARRTSGGASVVVTDPDGRAKAIVEAISSVSRMRTEAMADGATRLVLEFSPPGDRRGPPLEEIVGKLVAAGVGVREAAPVHATLEDVFAELTLADTAAAREGERP